MLSLFGRAFSKSEANEVQEFIDAGEYGLALNTLIGIVDEESKLIPQKVMGLAKDAAVAMGLDEIAEEERLIGFVVGSLKSN